MGGLSGQRAGLAGGDRDAGPIAALAGGRAIYVEQFRGPDRALGRAFPAHATALGKALLAESPQAVLDELVLEPWTERTIVDPKAFAKDLATTRKRGWALEDGELDLGRRSVGSAVRDHRGTAVAAIGVGGFAADLPDERVRQVGRLVVAEARRVSEALGAGLAELRPPKLEVEVLAAVEAARAGCRGRAGEGEAVRSELFTADEVAERLRVTRAWVLAEARAGRLAHYRLNRKVRFTWEQVEGFLAERCAGHVRRAEVAQVSAQVPAALFPDGTARRGTVASHRPARPGAG